MGNKKDISNSITKIGVDQLPDFMQQETVTGLETLKGYIVPSRIKVVQKQASDELLKTFSAGDVILSPMNALVTEMARDAKGKPNEEVKTSFKFVPIFFFPEWATVNPIELKNKGMPFIRYRTSDPSDPVAAKAKNASLRTEMCPEDPEHKIKHVEFLNYVGMLYNHPLGSEPVVLGFSKGEWSAGTKFAALIKMRQAAIYGCIFEAVVTHRIGQLGDWYGLNIINPEDGSPWVSKEKYDMYKKLHLEFAKLHAESRIRVQIEPEATEEDEAQIPANPKF